MRTLIGSTVVAAALALCPAANAACVNRDVRTMLAEAGQGMNGRVIAKNDRYLTIVAESTYSDSIKFQDTVRVYGPRLPATVQGRIGIAVHRDGDRWRADRCDIVPGGRMANALHGSEPCPAPRVRIAAVRVDGRNADVTLRFSGDVTGLRVDSGQTVRRLKLGSGTMMLVHRLSYTAAGRYRAKVTVEGGVGPGCPGERTLTSSARKTITVD